MLRQLLLAALVLRPAASGSTRARSTCAVIGEPPKIVDPAAGPLTEPARGLLANVAQGLVRFDARGQIEPGLAERWNVSDDGLSYIFRLQPANGRTAGKITAQQVARMLERQIASRSNNPLKDTLGAIDEIVAMTDRVLEISLKAPRPHLLQLLAQPEFAIWCERARAAGPFKLARRTASPTASSADLERACAARTRKRSSARKSWSLGGRPAAAVAASSTEETDLVLGGTFADLPYARAGRPAAAMRCASIRSPGCSGSFRRARTARSPIRKSAAC